MRLLPYQLPVSRFRNNFWSEQLAHLEIAVSMPEVLPGSRIPPHPPRPANFDETIAGKIVKSILGKGFYTAVDLEKRIGFAKKNIGYQMDRIKKEGYRVTVKHGIVGDRGRPSKAFKIEKGQ